MCHPICDKGSTAGDRMTCDMREVLNTIAKFVPEDLIPNENLRSMSSINFA